MVAARHTIISLVRRHVENDGDALPADIPVLVIRLFMLIWLGFLTLPILRACFVASCLASATQWRRRVEQ